MTGGGSSSGGSDASATGGNAVCRSGEKNNSLCVPANMSGELAAELSKHGVSGIQYKDGVVDFSPVSHFDIPFPDQEALYKSIGSMPVSKLMSGDDFKGREGLNSAIRNEWQGIAKQQLLDKIQSDPGFAADFQSRTGVNTAAVNNVSNLSDELKRVGLTMHETPDCSMIQLIPTVIHDSYKHSGGTSAMLENLISGDVHSKYGI